MLDGILNARKPRAGSRSSHVGWLAISAFVLLMGLALEVRPGGRVGPRGVEGFALPELCWSKRWLGIPCPGCGLTRSVIHLMHGDVRASVATNPGGALIVICLAAQIPLRIIALRRGWCGLLERPVAGHAALWGIFVVLLVQFAWKQWGAAMF